MNRRAWLVTLHEAPRVKYDLATKSPYWEKNPVKRQVNYVCIPFFSVPGCTTMNQLLNLFVYLCSDDHTFLLGVVC